MWHMTVLRILLTLLMGGWLYHILLYLDGKRECMHLKIRKRAKVSLPGQWQKKCKHIYYAVLTVLITLCFLLIKIYV